MIAPYEKNLAIHGGDPVRSNFLIFGMPCLGEEEIEEVVQTLRSGWIGTGPRAKQFEDEFAAFVGSQFAISVNSCTAALHLSLIALGIGPGDEVISTPLTFCATVNVIEHVHAKPVFVDIDPLTLNIDPNRIGSAITPRTKAIIPVHFGGLSCDMDPIMEIADRYGLAVVEDAAHAIGTLYKGRMIGSFGKLTCFSFYANKNLTTAEGGMITTEDEGLNEKLRLLRLHGLSRDAWKRFAARRLLLSDAVIPGYKYNMPDLLAAIGIYQLRKQERFLGIREHYALIYDKSFSNLPVRIQPRPQNLSQNRHALHLYVLILNPEQLRVSRNEVMEALLAENIGVALHYRAVHTHPYYQQKYGYSPNDFPNAYRIGENVLSLPLTPNMAEEDVRDVVNGVRKVLGAYLK